MKGKIKCDECGKIKGSRFIIYFKGQYLCGKCRRKSNSYREFASIINLLNPTRKPMILEKAIKKEYLVKTYYNKKTGRAHHLIYVPKCFSGKKVKIRIIE
jgi:hypothetical protein